MLSKKQETEMAAKQSYPRNTLGSKGLQENVKICRHVTPHHIITRRTGKLQKGDKWISNNKSTLAEPKTSENLMY
jgi:hypothetical protein